MLRGDVIVANHITAELLTETVVFEIVHQLFDLIRHTDLKFTPNAVRQLRV